MGGTVGGGSSDDVRTHKPSAGAQVGPGLQSLAPSASPLLRLLSSQSWML